MVFSYICNIRCVCVCMQILQVTKIDVFLGISTYFYALYLSFATLDLCEYVVMLSERNCPKSRPESFTLSTCPNCWADS